MNAIIAFIFEIKYTFYIKLLKSDKSVQTMSPLPDYPYDCIPVKIRNHQDNQK